jgi:hypothetical protein
MLVKALDFYNDETMVKRTQYLQNPDYYCAKTIYWESTLFRPTPESIILQVESKMRAQTKPIPYLLGPKETRLAHHLQKNMAGKSLKIICVQILKRKQSHSTVLIIKPKHNDKFTKTPQSFVNQYF